MNGCTLNIAIAQGSVATDFRQGGKIYASFFFSFSLNYKSRSIFAKVITKIKIVPFDGALHTLNTSIMREFCLAETQVCFNRQTSYMRQSAIMQTAQAVCCPVQHHHIRSRLHVLTRCVSQTTPEQTQHNNSQYVSVHLL